MARRTVSVADRVEQLQNEIAARERKVLRINIPQQTFRYQGECPECSSSIEITGHGAIINVTCPKGHKFKLTPPRLEQTNPITKNERRG
jgi:hypothetical protein